jgi:hypothetical protein
LLTDCLKCLNANGDLLFSTISPALKLGDIRKIIEAAARKAQAPNIESSNILPSLDIALPGETSLLKSFLVRKESSKF